LHDTGYIIYVFVHSFTPGDCSSSVMEIVVVILATMRSFLTQVGTVYHFL